MAEGTPPGEGAGGGGGGIKGTLTKKWGPLPVWVYGLVGAGALFLLMRGRSSGGSSSGGFAVGSPLTAASAAPGTTGTDTASTSPADQSALLSALAAFSDAIRNQKPPVVNVIGGQGTATTPQSGATAGHDSPAPRQYTYASPGTPAYNTPKGAPMQNVMINGKVVPISLSDFAVKSGMTLPGAVPVN